MQAAERVARLEIVLKPSHVYREAFPGETMNIILVSENLSKARTIHLNGMHVAVGALSFFVIALFFAGVLNVFALRYAAQIKSPLLKPLVAPFVEEESARTESYLRDQLSAMAAKVGQMQAQLLRLDVLGERIASLGGFRPHEFKFSQRAEDASGPALQESVSVSTLNQRLDTLSDQVEDRGDKLGFLESLFVRSKAKRQLLVSVLPVEGGLYTSNFGWRIDPFTGSKSMHEGVDFLAEPGTPVLAAAAGVVVYAEHHTQYGNMVDIDHGNNLITRYAHMRKTNVKAGDVVQRGSTIGEVGSSGRATGPHLHFEVRENGVAQHPARFLQLPG